MQGGGDDGVPRQAIETFLYVSGQPAQALILIISLLDAGDQNTPSLAGLMTFPVSVDVCMAPLVGLVKHTSGMEGTESSVDHREDSYGPIVLGACGPFSLG